MQEVFCAHWTKFKTVVIIIIKKGVLLQAVSSIEHLLLHRQIYTTLRVDGRNIHSGDYTYKNEKMILTEMWSRKTRFLVFMHYFFNAL